MASDLIHLLRERVQRLSPVAQRPMRETPAWAEAFGLSLVGGAMHEVLSPASANVPRQFALMIAQAGLLSSAAEDGSGTIVWLEEPGNPWYAPAVARAAGVSADQILVLRPTSSKQALWALAECLGSAGVSATIATVPAKLTSIDARRLQLAAERGGGVGVLLRTLSSRPLHYAAATRWLVEPARGAARTQRWHVTLLHGQGGRVGTKIALEVDRETHRVRPSEELAGQSLQAPPTATRADPPRAVAAG